MFLHISVAICYFSATNFIYHFILISFAGQPSPCTRFIGLGKVSTSKDKNKKWLHALSLEPIVHMSKEDLTAIPLGTTDCPYVEVGLVALSSQSFPFHSGSGSSSDSHMSQNKRLKSENLSGKYIIGFMLTIIGISYLVY